MTEESRRVVSGAVVVQAVFAARAAVCEDDENLPESNISTYNNHFT